MDELKGRLDAIKEGESVESAIAKVGSPQGKEVKEDRVLVTWDVHSQQKVLYQRTLEFVDGKFTRVVLEKESV